MESWVDSESNLFFCSATKANYLSAIGSKVRYILDGIAVHCMAPDSHNYSQLGAI